ncbi:MAG TPA: tetratricopeptide repeat protein, partial [Myxococcaceae bacterium]|nr:tetratricopeptide repeat protein [Myxococcaceae bacterium]
APAADDAMSLDFGPPPEPATGAADFAEPAESAFGAFDEPAQTASPATGYQVRRRSGKIFGPFEEEVVQQMLRDGQLLGNEDVAQDGESWTPIGTVPAFAQTVQALMDSAPPPEAIAAPEATKSMDKLKKLYEGRMAQVAVLERSPEVSKAPKSGLSTALRRKAKTAAVVAGGVLILAGGASLGFTRYGAFGIKALFPAKLKPGSPEFAQLRRAREALVSGTYADYREALDLTGKLLTTREVPEVRAVWDQAVFYLQRRYGAKDVDPARRADASLEDIQLLGTKHVEVAKARAGAALRDNRPDDALPLLQDAAARADNAQDVELTLLRAEAYAAKKQGRLAKELLEKVPSGSAGSAKALHALGELHRGEGKADLAAKAFARALEANGRHVRSAVELAEVELFMRNDPVKAQAATARALHPDRRKQLGSGELSRAQALQGSTLLAQNKPKEALAVLEEAQKNDPTSAFAKAQLGRAYLALQDYAKAAPLLAEASRAEPKNLPYVEGALTALMAVGQVDEAAKRVEAANARFPGNARLAYFQGRVNDAQDKPAEAEAHYKRAISADPNLHEAQLALARLLLRFRRVADAKGPLEEAAKQFPDNPLIRAGRGELALAEDNLELAQAEFEKAAELDPNLADAYLGLAKVSIERSAPDKARVWAEKAIALNPALPEGRLQLGLALWKSGKVAEAVAELEKAKEANPKSGPVAVTIGAVKMDTGDLAGAEASLRSALVSEPSNPQALFYLAQVRSRKSEHTGAVENMREALERMPNNPEYHHQMGLIYRAARRPEDSVASWKKATELDPGHVTSWQALGEAYLLREEFAPAIAAFESGLKAAPGNGTLLALIGDAYFESQKWQQAVARYQAALRSDPKLVRVIYKVARAYSEQGRPADAMAWYKRAASAEPQNPMPFYYLGFAFKEKNQRQAAIEAFKAYLAKRPDADDKREISDEIYDLQQLK